MSGMAMSMLLRRMKVEVTVHGFRSGFRDWSAESTGYAPEVAEMALAHTIENKVERAYRRGDLFEKRRRLMDDWATCCANDGAVRASVVFTRAEVQKLPVRTSTRFQTSRDASGPPDFQTVGLQEIQTAPGRTGIGRVRKVRYRVFRGSQADISPDHILDGVGFVSLRIPEEFLPRNASASGFRGSHTSALLMRNQLVECAFTCIRPHSLPNELSVGSRLRPLRKPFKAFDFRNDGVSCSSHLSGTTCAPRGSRGHCTPRRW